MCLPYLTIHSLLAKDSCVATFKDQFDFVSCNVYTALDTMACSLLCELCPLNSVQVLYYPGSPISEYLVSTFLSTLFSLPTTPKGHVLGYPSPCLPVSQQFLFWCVLNQANAPSCLEGIAIGYHITLNRACLDVDPLYSPNQLPFNVIS